MRRFARNDGRESWGVRQNTIFFCSLKLIWPVQSLREKYSSFVFSEFVIVYAHPVPRGGRFAIVTRRRVRDAVAAGVLQRALCSPTNGSLRT